ncbi:hypothetical protein NKR23_g9165 [Pleurostoma richardsiae]|uniref:Uncharacterized protein n=1 Tax=Pleurostoma richardsiae TaxID=41990 RepID=A0AA38RD99_9PEZI|nr:hypothetical protein NKR23_g9165 [Pleurostoma richardsiae]
MGSGLQNQLGRRLGSLRAIHRFDGLVPQLVALPTNKVRENFAGDHHSFALTADGSVWACGRNNNGQTGIPVTDAGRRLADKISVPIPTRVSALQGYKVRTLTGGPYHSIACTEEGQVLAWGRYDSGQVRLDLDNVPGEHFAKDPRGRRVELSVPTVVPELEAIHVAAGIDWCVAITAKGQDYSWGFSSDYRTGLGMLGEVVKPRPMTGIRDSIRWAGSGRTFRLVIGRVEGR